MLLQAYDFLYLNESKNVNVQIWWQDQWWNLVTWVELIRKKLNKETFAVTWPLIIDSNWKKFWKSEWNAIWLDKNKTTPYEIYQYFMNTDDNDIERFLKILTLMDIKVINRIVEEHFKEPEKREWQKRLAFEVVKIIHWEEEAKLSLNISNFMFWKTYSIE